MRWAYYKSKHHKATNEGTTHVQQHGESETLTLDGRTQRRVPTGRFHLYDIPAVSRAAKEISGYVGLAVVGVGAE